MSENGYLLEVKDLKKHFFTRRLFSADKKPIRAVDGISFSIRKGETLGLVGESGCGKTTAGKSILRLIEPTSGTILFNGQDILRLDSEPLRTMRRRMQYIFQDPYESLNPRMKVNDIVGEGLEVHGIARGREKTRRVSETLFRVGLHPQDAFRYAHEFSGGQRQRIGIARAVALNPELIIADEPVSALDVSIQAQILNLLSDLRDQLTLTYIFISHDLRVVKHISDRIVVMYRGKIVEMAQKNDLFIRPLHPYTRLLLEAIPKMRAQRPEETYLGEPAPSSGSDKGCLFQPKCSHSKEKCESEEPVLLDMGEGHFVSCHFLRGPSE